MAKVGGLNTTDTTGIIFSSIAGIDTTHPGIALFSYSDPLDTSKCEWISYTSINPSTYELQGVVRGCEGFSAHNHDNGCAIAFPISKSHINDINDILNGVNTIYPASLARQALINGNFDVWQRGTSGTTFTDGVSMFVADRWYDSADDDGGTKPTITRSQQLLISGDISNAFYYSRLAMDGAGTSLGVNSYHVYIQKVEHGVRNLCGLNKSVTVSFWARSDIVNKRICPTLRQNYGTGGSPSSAEVIKGTPITLTTSWVKYTATFTTNTLVGKTFGTDLNDYLGLFIYHEWGTTWGNTYVKTSVTAETYGNGYIDIAQVQLCAGDVALPFMPKNYDEELKNCEKFYEKSYSLSVNPATDTESGCISFVTPSTTLQISIPYRTRKRSVTTPTIYTKAGVSGKIRDITAGSDVTPAGIVAGETGFIIYGSSTANHVYEFHYITESEL